MKKNKKIFLVSLIVILLSVSCVYFIKLKKEVSNTLENNQEDVANNNEQNDFINISEYSEEFMEDYFKESKEIHEKNDKENILIVTSKEKIKNTFGAANIVEAPNNQYILQYDSEEDKNKAFEELEKLGEDFIVEENIIYTINETEYNSWGIEKMALDYAILDSEQKELNDITVAIIDTGCDMDLFNEKYPEKISEIYNVLEPGSDMTDENGHGTHVAGTIAEGTPSNVKILPVKVTKSRTMYNTDIIEAINYISYYDKADVINMSFGSYGYSEAIEQAINSANQKNIISVAAAGNDNTSANHYPSALDNTISVAAVDSNLSKADFSNYGAKTTFTAPGVDILSLNGTLSGTSMATPHAVSAVAILKSYNKDLTLEDTIELLKVHAIDLGDAGWDKYYGYGLISFAGAQFSDGPNDDGTNSDKYGVFKKESERVIEKIEIATPTLLSYNYGTIYNLLSTKMRIYYGDEIYTDRELWELDGLEISGYDPYSNEEQIVEVKYKGFTTNFTITNPSTYESGWEYSIIDEDSIELTLYKDSRIDIGKLYIPETIDGYNVVSLAGNSQLMSKVFGNSYDYYAFEEIILPKTLTKLGRASLMNTNAKKVVSLADNISLGEDVFGNVKTLTTFVGTISELGEGAFLECSSLDNVILVDTMTSIPKSAFNGCYSLENINIPSKLTSIGAHAFENTKIKEIVIPNGVTKIEKLTFSGCTNLESVVIPETVTEIETNAFYHSNIREIFIPENVAVIGSCAFGSSSSLESIVVHENNPVYDSRENCNAIIESKTNKLIQGCANTIIPSTITTIGSYAFVYNLALEEIVIPNGVTEIQEHAFYGCDYLEKITMPRSVTTIGENAFKKYSIIYRNDGTRIVTTFWLYTDSYAKTYAVENEIAYEALDLSYVLVHVKDKVYKAFENVNTDDIVSIKLYYDRGNKVNDTYKEYTKILGREEIVNDGYTIKYMNDNDSFRYGDTYFTIVGKSETGEEFEKQIDVTVSKLDPIYNIPENLTAQSGTRLSEITLPDGFEWMDETQIVEGIGNVIYKAKYIPEDTNNYKIIEDIEITINVKKDIIGFSVNIPKKEYKAFETVNAEETYITIQYYDGDVERITEGIIIKYTGENTSFRYGDTYYTVSAYSKTGEYLESQINVTVEKADPIYSIPENLTAQYGMKLSEITLPDGFEWMDETQIIEDTGNLIYKAKYIPNDTNNYKVIENIEIIINVKKDIIGFTVNIPKKEYKAFETVNAEEIYISVQYYDGDVERITEGITIKYTGDNTSFRYGDTYYTVSTYTTTGEYLEKQIQVTVTKVKPKYVVPTNIEAISGQKLSQIQLPEGFEWMDETQIIEGTGNVIYKAKYISDDTINYEIVENIEITINVKEKINNKYVGNINSELITFNVAKNDVGATYVSGQVVVVEWVNGVSTVPEVAPKMSFKSTDNTVNMEVFVTATGTNTYYFDRFIEGINTSKEYFFEIESGNENNISENRSMNVYFTNTKYNDTIVGKYHDKRIRLLKQKILFEDDTYIGNINSELITFNVAKNNSGATYVSGQVVVVEWVNGVSTVPEIAPKMRFKSTDGIVNMEVFVTPTGTNTYYFDRFIEGIDTTKEYFFEIESGDERNVSPNRSMNVYFTNTKYNDTVVGNYHEKQIRLLKQKILFEDRTNTYVGNINSELITFNVAKNNSGATYVSGQVVVVEWVNGQSTVPEIAPIMQFKSTDGKVNMEVFVTPTGTNTYYFDRYIEGIDTSKEYYFEIASGDPRNVSLNKSMNVYFNGTKYNDTVVGYYLDKQIRLLNKNIIFENYQAIYITKTGKRYHYDNTCNGATYILSTLQEALSKGLTPCEKCVQ